MVFIFHLVGFDPFHETQKGLADLLESESKAAELQAKVAAPSPPGWESSAPPRARLPPPGFHPAYSGGGAGYSSQLQPALLPPQQSSAVDSLFGLPRPRPGPAPGFGQQGGQQVSDDLAQPYQTVPGSGQYRGPRSALADHFGCFFVSRP